MSVSKKMGLLLGLLIGLVAEIGPNVADAQNVIAHYSFDGSVNDSGANGLHLLTGAGAEAYASGQFGQAIDLSGGSDNYFYNSSSLFDFGTNNFAIAFWYQSDHVSGDNPFAVGQMVTKDNASSARPGFGVNLTGESTEPVIAFDVDSGEFRYDHNAPANDDTVYQHIVLQRLGGNVETYLNGTLISSIGGAANANVSAPSYAFAVGARGVGLDGTGGAFGLDGRIDELWVLDNALLPAQVEHLMMHNELLGLMLGDFNLDFEVDLADYWILRDHMQGHLDGPVGYANGDINRDGAVDLEDFGIFKSIYPGGAAGLQADLAAVAVPEPSTILLSLCGMAGLLGIARRRDR